MAEDTEIGALYTEIKDTGWNYFQWGWFGVDEDPLPNLPGGENQGLKKR